MRRWRVARHVLAAVTVCAVPAAAGAQPEAPAPRSGGRVSFLSDYVFHLGAGRIRSDEERFVWDADIGGRVDLLDYRAGRVQFLANYNVGLGEQLRRFDPVQGNYQLDVSASYRAGGHELAGVFHHLSRHLSDRPKVTAVDWNMAGVRWSRRDGLDGVQIDSTAHLFGTVKRSFADYTWEGAGRMAIAVPVAPGVSIVGSADLRLVGVDETVAGRGRQTGWRTEGGARLAGTAAAVELFVAAEQRVDPYPLERGTARWAIAGFRIVSRER